MRNLILIFIALFISSNLMAQMPNPVKWETTAYQTIDGAYQIVYTASIEDGWHLYSQFLDDGGPIPTSFNYEEGTEIELIGDAAEASPKIDEMYDEMFGMDLKYFSESATFSQKLSAEEGTSIKGYLEYMVCDDHKCLPPTTVDYELVLTDLEILEEVEAVEESIVEEMPTSQPTKAVKFVPGKKSKGSMKAKEDF